MTPETWTDMQLRDAAIDRARDTVIEAARKVAQSWKDRNLADLVNLVVAIAEMDCSAAPPQPPRLPPLSEPDDWLFVIQCLGYVQGSKCKDGDETDRRLERIQRELLAMRRD